MKYINTMFDEIKKIEAEAEQLQHLSGAFFTTGNSMMSEILLDVSMDLRKSVENIRKVISEESSKNLELAQQSSDNLLRAALAW